MATDAFPIPADKLKQLTDYIGRQVVRRPGVEITENTSLVSSGLIDSFALIEVFLELEKITNRKIPVGKVRAKDMETVRMMLVLAERMGKPKE